jgi:hypothetical protein
LREVAQLRLPVAQLDVHTGLGLAEVGGSAQFGDSSDGPVVLGLEGVDPD